jgi:hypothetical protein
MGGVIEIFSLFKAKNVFKCHLIKSYHSVISKNKVNTYGASVLNLIIAPLF